MFILLIIFFLEVLFFISYYMPLYKQVIIRNKCAGELLKFIMLLILENFWLNLSFLSGELIYMVLKILVYLKGVIFFK